MKHVFFGIQIALYAPPGDPWRSKLHALVRAHRGDQSLLEKRAYYNALTACVSAAAPRWRFGSWDFIAPPDGDAEFDSWVSGLEGSASENPGDDIDDEHVVLTLVFLVEEGGNSALMLAERCDLPESQWFTATAFARLLDAVRALSFSSVRADGAYAVPGEGGPGLSAAELQGEGWDYLQPIQGVPPPVPR